MQQSVISMTAPANVKVKVFGVDAFIEVYKKNPIHRRTMLILTNSIDAYRLARGGVNFPVLNVGGMRFENDRIKSPRLFPLRQRKGKRLRNLWKWESMYKYKWYQEMNY